MSPESRRLALVFAMACALSGIGPAGAAMPDPPRPAAPPSGAPAGAPANPRNVPPRPGAAPAAGPATIADEPHWGPLPADLVPVLEAKSAGYIRRALKFSCRESIREARYSEGEAQREYVREYDYLLVKDDNAPEGFVGARTKPGAKDFSSERVDLAMPEPYLWSALFDPRVISTVRFQVGTWHTTPWRLAIPIEWTSAAPVFNKQRIIEWSGTVDVEFRSGNLVRVVARPSMQDQRLAAELDRYLTSFRFMGFSTASPPVGQELTVEFEFEHEGFTYPTRVELVTFQQVHADHREILNRRTIEYSNYRFFGAKVEDRIPPLTWRPPQAPPPLAPPPR